jgi:hypothetical protein
MLATSRLRPSAPLDLENVIGQLAHWAHGGIGGSLSTFSRHLVFASQTRSFSDDAWT